MLPFLVHALAIEQKQYRVIDLGAGSGCDAVGLAQRGFRVVGNEIDPVMLAAARQLGRRTRTRVRWQSYDWNTIGDDQPGTAKAAYLVGNSFCLLRHASDRQTAASQFAKLLSPGGRLVVDERNFEYILRDRIEILRGNFRYSRTVVYCGKTVSAIPSCIEDDQVTFAYHMTGTGEFLGELHMYPFRRGELVHLFAGVGLALRAEYSDLKLGYSPEADFHAYVFERVE